ncbi:MAG: SGNH/GDSL hydrolase family protein, partial [Methylococcaceae bacterium]|nr:SGNH/GDSL hydrolase family protein [Methylococcaceae bacterium]
LASLFLYLVCPVILAQENLSDLALRSLTVRESGSRSIKILPLGDSITDSYLGRPSYRRPLWHQLQAAGYNIDFVGRPGYRHTTAPIEEQDYDLDHEGHAGWRADQIRSHVFDWMSEFSADIVLLHIGTNDLLQAPSGETVFDTVNFTLNDIDGIIQNLRARNSSIVILLAKIIPMGAYDTAIFNNEVDAFVSTRTTTQSPVVVVDQYTGFNAINDTHDDIHPNEAGEIKMANKWFQALEPFLTSTTTPLTHLLPHNQWHQISLPLNPGSNNTVADIFGDDGLGSYGTDWGLYSYNPGTNSYDQPGITDTLSQGVGYWIIQMSGDDKILKMPAGSTETPTTNPTGCPVGKDCFEIPLATESGADQWNMVGYPFAVSGLLSDSRIVATTSNCTSGCEIDDAEIDGVFHNQLWTYNGTEYVEVSTTIGTLDPWLGYWAATLNNASTNNPSLLFSK